jgi:DNA polymerase III sliding clamp (beta) subunit (PCNA family)
MQVEVLKLRNALGLLEGLTKPKVEKVETTVKNKRGRSRTKVTKERTWPVLRNVMLQDGRAVATDLDIAVMVDLPEATLGRYLLPFKQVSKLLTYVPGNQEVTIEMQGNTVLLTWPEGSATYATESLDDYPVIPEIKSVMRHSVSADILVPALVSMLDYCAQEEARPVLSSVILLLGNPLEVAAGDGFRMAFKTLTVGWPTSNGISSILLPAKVVDTLAHLWRKAPRPMPDDLSKIGNIAELVVNKGNMEIGVSPILILVKFGSVSMLAKTTQGTPPNFKEFITSAAGNAANKVQLYGADLERALRRIAVPSKEKQPSVRMVWAEGKMVLSSEAKEGNVETTIPVQTFNGAGRIAINRDYLQEYASAKEGLITMACTTPTAPVVFTHSRSPLVAIMPMQVIWPDQVQPEVKAEAIEEAKAKAEEETTETEEPGENDPTGQELDSQEEHEPLSL